MPTCVLNCCNQSEHIGRISPQHNETYTTLTVSTGDTSWALKGQSGAKMHLAACSVGLSAALLTMVLWAAAHDCYLTLMVSPEEPAAHLAALAKRQCLQLDQTLLAQLIQAALHCWQEHHYYTHTLGADPSHTADCDPPVHQGCCHSALAVCWTEYLAGLALSLTVSEQGLS